MNGVNTKKNITGDNRKKFYKKQNTPTLHGVKIYLHFFASQLLISIMSNVINIISKLKEHILN
jgi:hypothetical protein